MEIQLTEMVRVRFEPGGGLADEPRWDILHNRLRVGPFHGVREAEAVRISSIGSHEECLPSELVDELFFDPSRLGLCGLLFWVPRENLVSAELLETWRDSPIQTGTLRLLGLEEFTRSPANFRWLDAGGMGLVCVTHAAFNPGDSFARLRIAPDLDLLCKDNEYVGWSLASGERAIVSGWEPPTETPADPELKELTRQYLVLVTARAVDRMLCGDPVVRQRLLHLQQQAAGPARRDARCRVLYQGLTELLDRYYRPHKNKQDS